MTDLPEGVQVRIDYVNSLLPKGVQLDTSICPPMSNSITALASKANAAANRYRELVDSKANYYVLRSAGNELRAATDALVSAIADEMS